MDREELLGDERLSLQLGQVLSDLKTQRISSTDNKQFQLQSHENSVQKEPEFDVSYKYKRNKKSKDQAEAKLGLKNQVFLALLFYYVQDPTLLLRI